MKRKVKRILDKTQADKVKICTPKFCATGFLDYDFEDDFIVALSDAEVVFNNDPNTFEHKENICISDDYIVSFEPVKHKKKDKNSHLGF